MKRLFKYGLLAAALLPQVGNAQELSQDIRQKIGSYLDNIAKKEIAVGRVKIDSVAIHGKNLQLFANMNWADFPFREGNVAEIYQGVSDILPTEFKGYKLEIHTNKRKIEELIPQTLRSKKDKKAKVFAPKETKPLVSNISAPYVPTNGLYNRHIAMWQSHGWYFEPKLDRWEWQRARIFQTVEDLYTQSYVLPFLVPMLENAGANVLMPRERDLNTAEIVIDNDGVLSGNSTYVEKVGDKKWMKGNGAGFAHLRNFYKDFENPFKEGTYRAVETIKKVLKQQ